MKLSPTHCQQLAHVGVAGAIIAAGSGALAPAAVCGSVAGLSAASITAFWRTLNTKDPNTEAAFRRVAESIEKDARWAKHVGGHEIDVDQVSKACALIVKFGPKYWPAHDVVAKVVGREAEWPDAVARHLVKEIAAHEKAAGYLTLEGGDLARETAEKVAAAALRAAMDEPDFVKQLQPHLMMEALSLSAEICQRVENIGDSLFALQGGLNLLTDQFAAIGLLDDKLDRVIASQLEQTDLLNQILANQAEEKRVRDAAEKLPKRISDTGTGGGLDGQDFVSEIVRLAKSKLEIERRAAVLKLQGDTADAYDLIFSLAKPEAEDAAARFKSAGLIAFNDLTAKSIVAYERAIGCNPDDAEAHNHLGLLYDRTGDLDRAKAAYEKVLALGNQWADKTWIAAAYGNLGLIEKTRGNLDAAEAYHKKSLEIEEALGRKHGMVECYANLGVIERTRGNLDAAEAYHKKSLALSETIGLQEGMAACYGNLGLIERTRGNLDAAEAYHKKSLELNEALGLKEGMASDYGNLGRIEQTRGNLGAAEAFYKISLEIEEALGRKEGMASAYGNLGLIERTRGNLDGAEAYHKKSLALDEALGRKDGMAAQYGNLGLIERTRGNLDAAEANLKKALALHQALGRKEVMARDYCNLGLIEQDRGNIAGAMDYWRQALALYQEIGMPHMVEKVQGWIDEFGGET